MSTRKPPNSGYRALTDVLGQIGRIAWVTTSIVATTATVVALVAVAMVLIFSL
jgi:hypothetical protein